MDGSRRGSASPVRSSHATMAYEETHARHAVTHSPRRHNAFPYPTYPARTRVWVSLAAPGGPMVTLGYAGDSARQVPAGSSFGQF